MKQNSKQTQKYFQTPGGWESLTKHWKELAPSKTLTAADHFLYLFVTGRDIQKGFKSLKENTYHEILHDMASISLIVKKKYVYRRSELEWGSHITPEAVELALKLFMLYKRCLWS